MDSEQQSLDLDALADARAIERAVLEDPSTTIDLEVDFRRFHRENPGVYAALVRLARQAKDAGHRRLSIKMLWEIVRWEMLVGDTSGRDFKLNNSYTSRYARLIMEEEDDLYEFFETRRLST